MKLLLIHARSFKYRVVEQAVSEPEEAGDRNTGDYTDILVVFTTIESRDSVEAVDSAVNEILDVYSRVRAKAILIYPYAHLSQDLAPPHIALKLLKLLEERMRERTSVEVYRAPFGWYKEFQLDCYGHPLSELSRSIVSEQIVRKIEIRKKFYILTPDGKLHEPSEFDYSNYFDLKILVDKEVYGRELTGGINRVNDYCRKFGFEWEYMSDHGHMRYGPHAFIIMDLVMQYAWQIARELGIPVFRVMGTNMFNLSEKPVYEHALLFGDRLYEVQVDNERFVLRYAACHQQFAMLRDWVISYRNLPFGVFELADSYRLEQRGEVSMCFRLRKFYMPDLHVLTRDLSEAVEVSKRIQRRILDEVYRIGRRYVALYNVTEDFFNKYFDKIVDFVKNENYPVLLNVISPSIYYWVLNVEYHIIDNLNRPREIATFQIDIGNSDRFGIKYIDENNEKKNLVIIHTAIIGGVERYIYAVLDTAALTEKRGETPYLPTWLSPIQVRVVPLTKEYLDYATKVAMEIFEKGFRVDIDDRNESLGKKIRDAAREWIPYIVVIGDREVKTNTINLRIRRSNEQRVLTTLELIKLLEDETGSYPKTALTLPIYLSQRPVLSYQV